MKKLAVKYASNFLAAFALLAVSAASWWIVHQPEVPQELLKK